MMVKKKLKNVKKLKFIRRTIFLVIVIYSLIFSILFSSVLTSVNNTIESISVPNGTVKANFNPQNPEIEIPVYIENDAIWEITDFCVEISLDLVFIEINSTNEKRLNIFQKEQNFEVINGMQIYKNVLEGDKDDFDLDALNYFWRSFDVQENIEFLLDIKVSGRHFQGIIPFSVEYEDVELEMTACLTCG